MSAPATTIHQWLGPNDRLTLWRVTTEPDSQAHVGTIMELKDERWIAFSVRDLRMNVHDTRNLAADDLCARLGIERVGLPGENDSTEEEE